MKDIPSLSSTRRYRFYESLLLRRKCRASGEKPLDVASAGISMALDQVPVELEDVMFLIEDYMFKVFFLFVH